MDIKKKNILVLIGSNNVGKQRGSNNKTIVRKQLSGQRSILKYILRIHSDMILWEN